MRVSVNYHLPVLGLVAALFLTVSAKADQAAVAFDTTRLWGSETGTGVYGWQFTTRMDIRVLALGLYDNPGFSGGFAGDGFIESHAIGIWDVSNHSGPIVSSLISTGTVAVLDRGFRYVNINPTLLPADHDYVVAALFPNIAGFRLTNKDFFVGDTGDPNTVNFVLTVSPEIDFGGYRSIISSTLLFPETYSLGRQLGFGPNFTYTVIPEPSTFDLLIMAVPVFFCSLRLFDKAEPFSPNSVRRS